MRITIIGSGNVATHLAAALKNAGHLIVQVYSRNIQNAALLAYHVKAEAIDSLDELNTSIDIFIIAVNDDVIGRVAGRLAKYQKLMVHTSGATDLFTLLAFADNVGVFYPLQTFSKVKEVDFAKVPLCIEGANEQITAELTELAQTISQNVYTINSEKRKTLHLAAVFACNFPNYLYELARQLLAKQGMEFDMLRPLIIETAEKVQSRLPMEVQTGPAIRNDETTMDFHLQLLSDKPELQELYRLLSQGIIKLDIQQRGEK